VVVDTHGSTLRIGIEGSCNVTETFLATAPTALSTDRSAYRITGAPPKRAVSAPQTAGPDRNMSRVTATTTDHTRDRN